MLISTSSGPSSIEAGGCCCERAILAKIYSGLSSRDGVLWFSCRGWLTWGDVVGKFGGEEKDRGESRGGLSCRKRFKDFRKMVKVDDRAVAPGKERLAGRGLEGGDWCGWSGGEQVIGREETKGALASGVCGWYTVQFKNL